MTETQKPYQVDPAFPHVRDNRRLTLKHGSMERAQPMTLVSSGDIENVRPRLPPHAAAPPHPGIPC